jgi:flagellar hook-associated protein 3 FlgL
MISGTRYRLDLQIARQTRLAGEIARGQTEIAAGKRILAPSDDPIGSARVAEIGKTQADEAVWGRNVETAATLAARADTTLASVATGVDRAKELMLTAASGTMSADNRATIATELRGIADDIASRRTTLDPRGEPLFRTNGALEIPVGPGERITAVGTRDSIFDAPVDLVAVIRAAAAAAVDPVAATRSAATTSSLAALDAAALQVSNARAEQGVQANRLDQIRDRLSASGLQLDEQKSGLQDVDVTAVVAQIQSRQLNLQAAQAIFAKVNQNSLFDLIR